MGIDKLINADAKQQNIKTKSIFELNIVQQLCNMKFSVF